MSLTISTARPLACRLTSHCLQSVCFGSSSRSSLGGVSLKSYAVTTGLNTSALPSKPGRKRWESGLNTSNLVTRNKTPMSSDSTGRYGMNGYRSTIGTTWQRYKTLQRSGCGLTTTTDPIWPWADSLLNSGWPWLHNVSISNYLAKGED